MTKAEKNIKRGFDVLFSCIGLLLLGWFILIIAIVSKIVIGGKGFFKQERVGHYGNLFTIYKIETIHPNEALKEKPYISKFGQFIRNYKIDEFPQLYNILTGTMSFVGPRPDLPGFADKLTGNARVVLNIKPGLTGPASIYFRNEELLLMKQEDPVNYNRNVIWPKKVFLNVNYVNNYIFFYDIKYVFKTFFK